ncbi:MAG TPA: hypothetical protein VF212_10270 [Longimicrobiales bacterium]
MTGAPRQPGAPEVGHLAAHLGDLAGRIAVDAVDRVWIFPTRRVAGAFSTVIVVSTFDAESDDRRRIITAHYTVRVDRRGRLSTQENVLEHGAAPADRLGRLIEGVLRRLDEDLLSEPPHAAAIGGDATRWAELVAALSDPASTGPSVPSELASADPFSEE